LQKVQAGDHGLEHPVINTELWRDWVALWGKVEQARIVLGVRLAAQVNQLGVTKSG
jgi:hypothetical protein